MSEKLSELQIIAAANQTKKVFEAMIGMLGVLEDKTGYEQQLSAAKGRVESIGKEEADARKKLAILLQDLADAESRTKAEQFDAKKIAADAKVQAEVTRTVAANEAAQIVQGAQADAKAVRDDAEAKLTASNTELANKQRELDKLQSTIDSKNAELTEIQGKLDAAKDEIRKKFL